MRYFVGNYSVEGTQPLSLLGALGLVRKILIRNDNKIALDVETQGDKVIMFQVGDKWDQVLIDTREYSPVQILECLATENSLIIGHNIKYDYTMLYKNYGIRLPRVWDTMLASQILTTGINTPKGYHSLQECARRWVTPYVYTDQGNLFEPVVTKKIRDGFASVVGDFTAPQLAYGATDIEMAFCLYEALYKALVEADLLITAELIENDFCLVAADMSMVGMPFNEAKWILNAEKSQKDAEALLNILKETADINWNSAKQVVAVFKNLGISPKLIDKETGEVKESVSALAIGGLKNPPPLLKTYLEYKRIKKLNTAYGMKFLTNINPQTGRIHTDIWQILNTGRTASSNPNLQNVPRNAEYRSCFEAPEGRVLVLADYSNQEARVLADLSKDPVFIEACKNSDIHLATARLAFNNPDLKKDSQERQLAKSMTFLTAYGGGAKKLSEAFGIPLQRAKQLIKTYYDTFKEVKPFFEEKAKETKSQGYILINDITRRKSYIGEYAEYKTLQDFIRTSTLNGYPVPRALEARFDYLDAVISRHSSNYRIQGTSADMAKLAGIYLRQKSIETGLFDVLLLIHD